jgi:hypothetical protein
VIITVGRCIDRADSMSYHACKRAACVLFSLSSVLSLCLCVSVSLCLCVSVSACLISPSTGEVSVSALYTSWREDQQPAQANGRQQQSRVCSGCELLIPTREHEMTRQLYCPGCYNRKFPRRSAARRDGGREMPKLDDTSFRLLPGTFLPAILEQSCMSTQPGGGIGGGTHKLWYQD